MTSTASTRRWLRRSVFDLELLEVRPGFLMFRATGKNVKQSFEGEAGGHRWQAVSGRRVHTSTVTVAVLDEPKEHEVHINSSDVEETFTKGSGPGGQHRNKTDSAVMLKHKPTGIVVRAENGKSQYINRQTAMSILRARLKDQQLNESKNQRAADRKTQVGSGMRGDKVRTIQVRNGVVVDHRTGKRMSYERYAKGYLAELR